MSGELFPESAVAMLSPRLKWMAEHGITARSYNDCPPSKKWGAYRKLMKNEIGYGHTEEEACRELGVLLNLKLWNEIQ